MAGCNGAGAAAMCLVCGMTAAAGAETHFVEQIGLTFVPEVVEAAPGDMIVWTWHDGNHTVTAGANCTPTFVFNAPLSSSSPSYQWTVPGDAPDGPISYFCFPHCNVGMVGTIAVVSTPPCPEDLDGSGTVDFSDLLAVLSGWGPCSPCPEDLDGSGDVGFGDLLQVLAEWGPCD